MKNDLKLKNKKTGTITFARVCIVKLQSEKVLLIKMQKVIWIEIEKKCWRERGGKWRTKKNDNSFINTMLITMRIVRLSGPGSQAAITVGLLYKRDEKIYINGTVYMSHRRKKNIRLEMKQWHEKRNDRRNFERLCDYVMLMPLSRKIIILDSFVLFHHTLILFAALSDHFVLYWYVFFRGAQKNSFR